MVQLLWYFRKMGIGHFPWYSDTSIAFRVLNIRPVNSINHQTIGYRIQASFIGLSDVIGYWQGCGSASLYADPDPSLYFNAEPYPSFYFNVYSDPAFTLMRIRICFRILLLIKVTETLIVHRPSMAPFWASTPSFKSINSWIFTLKLIRIWIQLFPINADPDPAFHSKCGSGFATDIGVQKKVRCSALDMLSYITDTDSWYYCTHIKIHTLRYVMCWWPFLAIKLASVS